MGSCTSHANSPKVPKEHTSVILLMLLEEGGGLQLCPHTRSSQGAQQEVTKALTVNPSPLEAVKLSGLQKCPRFIRFGAASPPYHSDPI